MAALVPDSIDRIFFEMNGLITAGEGRRNTVWLGDE